MTRAPILGRRLAAAAALTKLFLPLPCALLPAAAIAVAAGPALAEPAAAGPSVTVTEARTTEIVQSVLVAGSMIARDEVLVSPQVDGLSIVAILAEEGDRVAQGQVLARLDRTTLDVQKAQNEAQIARAEAAVAQANAQIAEADANLVQANNAFDRTKALRDSGNASLETYDQRAAAARSAQARANSARQALAIATADLTLSRAQGRDIEVRLARTEIKAPEAGIVSRRTAKLGATASMLPTSEPLYRIIAAGAVELEAQVAEVDIPSLKPGQPVAVMPAGAREALKGTIRLIAPEVDKASRLGRVRVALDGNPPVAIGSFARGTIETGRKHAVTLPLSAITYTRSGPTVQTVKSGKIATRKVTLGLSGGGRAEIATGLAAGETVVARAGTFVRDGDLITPVATN